MAPPKLHAQDGVVRIADPEALVEPTSSVCMTRRTGHHEAPPRSVRHGVVDLDTHLETPSKGENSVLAQGKAFLKLLCEERDINAFEVLRRSFGEPSK